MISLIDKKKLLGIRWYFDSKIKLGLDQFPKLMIMILDLSKVQSQVGVKE